MNKSEDIDSLMNEMNEFLATENAELRKAGCNLARAALHVISEYDGLHRLALAVAEWATAVANEGGRGKMYEEKTEVVEYVDDIKKFLEDVRKMKECPSEILNTTTMNNR